MNKIYKGSCLCGGIRFSVAAFSEKAANCYCSMCRKFHGAAFGTLVGVRGLQWLSVPVAVPEFIFVGATSIKR